MQEGTEKNSFFYAQIYRYIRVEYIPFDRVTDKLHFLRI